MTNNKKQLTLGEMIEIALIAAGMGDTNQLLQSIKDLEQLNIEIEKEFKELEDMIKGLGNEEDSFENTPKDHFENTMGIDQIRFKHKVKCFCPLGNKPATYNLDVTLVPDKLIPDYMYIQDKLNSYKDAVLTMEDFVKIVTDYIVEHFQPKSLLVRNSSYDAAHFPVQVTKRWEKPNE